MASPPIEKMKPVACDGDCRVVTTNNRNTYLAAMSALMYCVIIGMLSSYSAPATVDMQKPGSRLRGLTPDQITWIGSLAIISGIPGNILAGYFSHKFGRKAVIMFLSPLMMLGWLMVAYAPSPEWIYAGRTLSGFCTGFCVVALLAYVSEIASQEIRGQLSSGLPLALNLGILIILCLGIKLRWTWLAVSAAITTAIASVLMLFMPESPPWLVRQARIQEAANALRFLKGKRFDTKKEIEEIISGLGKQEVARVTYRHFLQPEFYKPIAISLSLMFFHSASGTGVLAAYTVEIFKSANSTINPSIASAIIGLVQVISSVVCGALIDRCGRRKLYISSGIATTASLTVLGAYYFAIMQYVSTQPIIGYIPLVTFIVYVFSFSFGLGAMPFVMIPEIVPIQFRSTVLSLATVFISAVAFVFVKLFAIMRDSLGESGLFWTYASFTFMSIIFGYFVLPETKQLSIQDIRKSFSKNKI